MATLFNTKIKDTYQSLLKLEDNTILTTTSKNITDGLGNASPLYMSTTRIGIGTSSPTSTFEVNGTTSLNGQFDVINGGANFRVTSESTSYVALKYNASTWASFNANDSYFQGTQFYFQSGLNFRFAGSGSFGFTGNPSARLYVKGSGTTSSTTSLLVQNSSNLDLLKITDDSTFYFKGASGTTLRIKSGIETNSSTIQFNNEGLSGGYSGGYTFTNGFGGNYGTVVSLRIYPGKVGIGNITEGTMQNNAMNLYVDNTQTGGRNKAIKLNVNFANISTEYNGIQFDTIENGSGGAFIGSQYNTATSSYGSDLAIFTTTESSTYTETARFVGKSQSLSIGAGKNPTARLHVVGSGSTSATSSLLVQNSSATELLKVTDDGTTTANYLIGTTGISALSNKFIVTAVGNQMRISNQAVGNYFYIGPTNVCGVDNQFTTPYLNAGNLSVYDTGGSYQGSTMSLGDFNMANVGLSHGLTISSGYTNNGAGGPNYGKQVRFYDNLTPIATQLDMTFAYVNPTINYTAGATGNVVGFEFAPVLTSVTAGLKIRAFQCSTGGVYVNTTTYQNSACLQADSTTQGFLPPRMTDAQIRAIASPVNGLVAYNTTTDHLCAYQGGAWVKFNHSPM